MGQVLSRSSKQPERALSTLPALGAFPPRRWMQPNGQSTQPAVHPNSQALSLAQYHLGQPALLQQVPQAFPSPPYPTPQPVYTSDPAAYYLHARPLPQYSQPQQSQQQRPLPAQHPTWNRLFTQQPLYLPDLLTPGLSPDLASASTFPFQQTLQHPLPSRPSSSSTTSTSEDLDSSPFTAQQLIDQRLPPSSSVASMSTIGALYNDAVRDLGYLKVDWLKAAIKRINSACGLRMALTGRKDDLHTRLKGALTTLYHNQDYGGMSSAKRIITELRQTVNLNAPSPAAAAAAAANYGSAYSPTASYSAGAYGTNGYASTSGAGYGASTSASTAARGAALPPPRFGGYNTATGASTSGAAGGAGAGPSWQNQRLEEVPIKFRPSPFYNVEKSLTATVTMPKAASGDRKNSTVTFMLTEAQRALINKAKESPSNPQYQVRLYCTSDSNWSLTRQAAYQFPAPIEFPPSAEIRLNGVTLAANVKGIKKQPGTAPPVDLTGAKEKAINLAAGAYNRVEVAYINTEKVFYLVVYLVEYTSVDKIVKRVKAGKTRSKDEVIKNIIDLNSDEEIEATALGLSLLDPLTFCRIDTPVRSVQCNHIACFDAATWFEMNEQTPTWLCPICSKTLKVDDMIVDGYFEDILAVCPEDTVDGVQVEPDGTWRSDDDKWGTAKPKTAPSSVANSGRNTPPGVDDGKGKGRETPLDGLGGGGGAALGGGGAADGSREASLAAPSPTNGKHTHVLTLDSDTDDDEPLAKRARTGGYLGGSVGPGTPASSAGGSAAPASRNGAGGGRGKGPSAVLDLTLDDSDEDEPAPVRAPPPRPGLAMAKVGSSNGGSVNGGGTPQPTGLAAAAAAGQTGAQIRQVQGDIDAMNKRMVEEYGPNWKETFGY
ncbi:hypothetical protein JCM8547_005348 [Rhodosporidiobolus lusitaniae]